MIKGFRVIESVLRGDEHLVFNLTVLTELNKMGLLNSFSASTEIFTLYQNLLPFLGNLKAQQKKVSGRTLFLTGSWAVLAKCLILRGEKVIIFHNFYSFLDSRSYKSVVKYYGYKILINLGRIKPVVLNKNIKYFVDAKTKVDHGVLQIAYNPEIIENIAPKEELENRIEKALYGNLYPGKINRTFLEIVNPKHFGKLHGGMKYINSINRYLSASDYYNLMRSTEKVCLFNKYNHRVASGVLADAVTFGKKIICFEDNYLQGLALEYKLECIPVSDYYEIDLGSLQEDMFDIFIKDLEKL